MTTNDPLYWELSAPVILILLSTLNPCAEEVLTVAIPEIESYAKLSTLIDSPVKYK